MSVSRISPFNSSSDDVESWTAVLQNLLLANNIDKDKDEDKKKASAILLSSVGVSNYSLIKDLVSPDPPESKSFDELVAVLVGHFKPAPKAIAERFKFYNRKQQSGESVIVFLSELRKLAVTCKFENLQNSLRDQFVVGLSTEAAQKRLFLEDDDLTLENAIKIAISQEAADASTQLIRGTSSSQFQSDFDNTHKVDSQPRQSWPKSQSHPPSSSTSSNTHSDKFPCGNCGLHHNHKCPAQGKECHKCHKLGHFAKFCRSKSGGNGSQSTCKNVKLVQSGSPPIYVTVNIQNKSVNMELDTGSSRSFISSSVWKKIGSPVLVPSSTKFTTYTDEEFSAKGQFDCVIQYKSQSVNHTLLVTDSSCLFGRDLLSKIQMDWSFIKSQCQQQVNQCSTSLKLDKLLEEYRDVFEAPVGKVSNFKAKLVFKDDAVPKFFRARPVPYALRDKVDEELQRMESSGVITRIEHSDWASPLVVVPKANGKVRITGDFKKTINAQLCVNQYPLARVDDLMETISGGNSFSKLDGSDAFHQIEVEEACKQYLVINTHRGLFQYNSLPQGIASSPSIFQEMMDKLLNGIPMSGAFVDDVIATGLDEQTHLQTLKCILQRFKDANYRLSRDKCQFLQTSMKFLGSIVCQEGIRTDPDKVEAVMSIKNPQNASDVKSFLGLVNFYGKFLPSLSTICAPLYNLTKKDVVFQWSHNCQSAFNRIKQLVSNSGILAHYSQSTPVGISCDASSVGLGVVLFHRYPNGIEKPIAFASKSLSSAEKNYSQIEKEALSIIFGLKKFVKFLYGRRFILVTDHNPLIGIFGSKKDVPAMAASRLTRWSLYLSGFQFDIEYRNTLEHGNADALSRLPLNNTDCNVDQEADSDVKRIQEDNPLTSKKVRLATSRDPVLSKVMSYAQSGWPEKQSQIPESVRPFFSHRHEYTVEQGIVMWGIRVVVPATLQQSVLQQLHDTHPGIVRMKSLARQFVFWPGIDVSIENVVKTCVTCCSSRDNPAAAPLHPWVYPEKPWQRVHIDLAGPCHNNMWLVMVDAFSKWPEVFPLGKDTTSANVIRNIRDTIARFGIMETIVSDNGPQFTSEEFQSFCKGNGIRHARSSAYHPRSNGEAERFVRTFKNALSSSECDKNLNLSVCDFLLTYRITPHATTGVSPSEALLKRKPRTLLDLLRPDSDTTVRKSQEQQRERFGHSSHLRQFSVGDSVWVRTFQARSPTWSLGTVTEVRGPLTYLLDVEGRIYKRHVDHIIDGAVLEPQSESQQSNPVVEDDDNVTFLSPEPEVVQPRRYPLRKRTATNFYRPDRK